MSQVIEKHNGYPDSAGLVLMFMWTQANTVLLGAHVSVPIDNVLLQTNPDFTSRFFEFINILERYLIVTLLHDSQTLQLTGFWGYRSG